MPVNLQEVLDRELTENQREAVLDPAQEVLCLACAGSGKSRALAYRIVRLIVEGEDPKSIAAFTFTEKAAESIKRRVADALHAVGLAPTVLGAMYIGTIHAYCQKLLGTMDARYFQFDVLDDNRLILYLMTAYGRLELQRFDSLSRHYFDRIRKVSDAWKTLNDELLYLDEVEQQDPEMGQVLRSLQNSLDTDEFIDFSFMVRRIVEALRNEEPGILRATEGLQHLLVDEYQDVNPAQEELIKQLHKRSKSLFAVGDDDQAIYAWRGADVSNILHFEQKHPNCSTHTLSQNFRSTPEIVAVADRFVVSELGATRMDKHPFANDVIDSKDIGVLWFDHRASEAEWVAAAVDSLIGTTYRATAGTARALTPRDVAVLMRSTRGGREAPHHQPFTQALAKREIPFTLQKGGSVFDRPQVGVLRDAFELLREGSPSRTAAQGFFRSSVVQAYPGANFDDFARVLTHWGRLIHEGREGTRRKVYPQQLVHDLLNSFAIQRVGFDDGVMNDIGVFSRMILDVESVYKSIDTRQRYQDVLNFLKNVAAHGYDSSQEGVLLRPDAVTVSTVHGVKGLEFPIVFIVDVEAQRFPLNKRNYSGWLPQSVLEAALGRGAYQATRDEEARLFYTAMTRAERYLYITGSQNLPGGKRPRKPSAFSQNLRSGPITLSTDPVHTPHALIPCDVPGQFDNEGVLPTSFTDIKYYLRCPHDYQMRKSFGFSPPVPELFGFGRAVHTAISRLHQIYNEDVPPIPAEAEYTAQETFHLKHVYQSNHPETQPGPYERARDIASKIVENYALEYRDDFARRREVEVAFEVPVKDAVISGSIDLTLEEDQYGRILDVSVIDFKVLKGSGEVAEGEPLHWTELALQVQLYAKAARDVLEKEAETGAVHLLRSGERIDIPVMEPAVQAAIANVEWAVRGIIEGDFPMRPESQKCAHCDFNELCSKVPQHFRMETLPPPISVPIQAGTTSKMARAFSEFEE
jgi:DNA helicase-2/ATP-dependent DNA helicase PcrA